MSSAPSPEIVAAYEWDLAGALLAAVVELPGEDLRRGEKDKAAWRAVELVGVEAFANPTPLALYEIIRDKFVAGERIDPSLTTVWEAVLRRDDPDLTAGLAAVLDGGALWSYLEARTDLVLRESRRRKFAGLLADAAAALQNGQGADGGRRLGQRMALRLMELWGATAEGNGRYSEPAEVLAELRERATAPARKGVAFPWPKLEHHAGPVIPGQDTLGISAYSGAGKSVFAANLFWQWVKRGVPCIGFPTEMGLQWVERGVAAYGGVSQWRAEKRAWGGLGGTEELARYLGTVDDIGTWGDGWVIVERANIAPQEIAVAVRVLRKRWPDQPVAFFVDHMHRLDYGGESADDEAAGATKMLRNLAMQDGGLIPVLLYQPRKPEKGNTYSPIAGYQIRGHSGVWNELSIHLSPYRSWVETYPDRHTPWGARLAKRDPSGRPKVVQPDPDREDRKLDDEHAYVKIDKRRVGGEGPTIVLEFDAPSGRVWEREEFGPSHEGRAPDSQAAD